MRVLHPSELKQVGGGVGDPVPHDNRDQARFGNNGFGNGADLNNNAPGSSGRHGPGRFEVGQGGGKGDSLGDDLGPR